MSLYEVVFALCLLTPAALSSRPMDCDDIYTIHGSAPSGVYNIYPVDDYTAVEVYCDMDTDGGRWTVFQRRMDGTVSFYRRYEDYKSGFGNAEGEYWLGLENLYHLTYRRTELRVDMEDFSAIGSSAFAQYFSFEVDSEAYGYMLHVDRFQDGGAGDSLSHHNGQKFSAPDFDQDSSALHCAKDNLGGYWYGNCDTSNPNGLYLLAGDTRTFGLEWDTWRGGASLKTISMKIRPLRRRDDQDDESTEE